MLRRTTQTFSKFTTEGPNHGFHGWEAPEGTHLSVLFGEGAGLPAVTETWLESREEAERLAKEWASK